MGWSSCIFPLFRPEYSARTKLGGTSSVLGNLFATTSVRIDPESGTDVTADAVSPSRERAATANDGDGRSKVELESTPGVHNVRHTRYTTTEVSTAIKVGKPV